MRTSGLVVHCANVAVSAPVPLRSRVKTMLGDSPSATRPILHPMSGTFAPGSMTLLLGQPGAGKSSLLKLLSGRLTHVHIDGHLTYNGVPMPDAAASAAYVGQRDDHYESLTVTETLAFAAACGGAPINIPAIVDALGLGPCADTKICELSGGERKRVTFGEMAFGDAPIVCLDEISTGLDSTTTHRLVSLLKEVAVASNKTVVMALLQPTPPVVDLFDSILLLHCGYVLYHGPVVDCDAYFGSIGLVCPPERDLADFLLDLGAPQMTAYCSGPSVPRDSASLASAFRASLLYTPSQPVATAVAPTPTMTSPYRALLMRQLRIFIRNTSFVHSRLVTVLVIGFMYATTFYDVDPATPATLMGVVFSTSIFLALGQIATLPSLLLARSTYYKHKRSRFFSPLAFVVAQALAPVPFALLETLICGSLVYWLAGFAASASAFMLFILLLLLTNLAFGAWFGLIGAIAPSLYIADPMALITILVTVVFAGFIVPLQSLPAFLNWIYWLNPLAWCTRAITISEYTAAKYAQCEHNGIDYCTATGTTSFGHAQLQTLGLPHDAAWVGYGVVFLFGSYLAYVGATVLALAYIEYSDGQNHHVVVGAILTTDDYTEAPSTPAHETIQVHAPLHAAPVQTPMTLAFQDISYSIRDGVQLLHNVSGYARPGTITALMGPSGAGKTTLLDVLAGRKTSGKITGRITINGVPAHSVAQYAGYCEQDDVHCDAATFREALHFSALLRQPSDVPAAEKTAFADACLELLDMESLGDRLIRGASVEQMKRLTIGVELAASPTILFLDEPTSGLDARSAKIVMDGVRHVASTGRTVVCTIHQPSSEVFSMFDALLLLQRGGRTAFFGPLGSQSLHLLTYFGTWHKAPAPDVNPATWMLDVLADDRIDYADMFLKSKEHDALVLDLASTAVSGLPAPSTGAPLMTQCYLLTMRFFRIYWRTPESLRTRLYIAIGLALLFALVFADVRYETYTGATAAVGMVYITTTYMGYINFNSAIPLASNARRSYYRERAAHTYAPLAYFVGSTLVEVPYAMATALLFTVIFAPLVGIAASAMGLYMVYVCLMLLLYVYMGQLMVYLLPTPETAILLGILLNSIFFLFYGFVPPASQIPSWYQWLHTITPPQYVMALLAAEAFGQCTSSNTVGCGIVHDAPLALRHAIGVDEMTVRAFVAYVYEMRIDDRIRNLVVTLVCILGVRLLALCALQFVQYRKR